MFENGLEAHGIECEIIRSRRLKRMQIQISGKGQVFLKVPLGISERRASKFLQENADWVRRKLDTFEAVPSLEQFLRENPRLSLHGEEWNLKLVSGKAEFSICTLSQSRCIEILYRKDLDESDLILACKILARKGLTDRLSQLSHRHGLKFHGVAVRDQKSRWGSCGETGNISLNWRLILLPVELQDHVLLHELAHLRHFDHSRAFHTFLGQLDPYAKLHAKQLKSLTHQYIQLGRI